MHSSLITPLDLSLHDLLPLLAVQSIAACCGIHSATPLCFHEGDPAMPDDLQLLLDNLDAKARELVGTDAADSFWETFLSIFYSFSLTLFGLFLGAWISTRNNEALSFSNLEATATIAFACISAVLIAIWAVIKFRQHKNAIRVPSEYLARFNESNRNE